MSKPRVAVLRGGVSGEYEVSLETGASVLDALDTNRFEPMDIVVTRDGEWLLRGRPRQPSHILHSTDVVFNALHGRYGEDGTVQRLFELHGVQYTGSKPLPSAHAMHKAITKDMLREEGILLPRHMLVGKEALRDLYHIATSIATLIGTREFIVKPVSGGSSLGVKRVEGGAGLYEALSLLLQEYDEIMVEEYIEGREATCAVIEDYRGESLYALPPVEIVYDDTVPLFTYEEKYNGKAAEICPPRFKLETTRMIENAAKKVHSKLELRDYSRADFIVSDRGVYFLEVNALPGMTQNSLLPKALLAVGASYKSFIEHVLTRALQRRHISAV